MKKQKQKMAPTVPKSQTSKTKQNLKLFDEDFVTGAVEAIEREVGKGIAIRAEGDYVTSRIKRVISTGCIGLDRISCKTKNGKIGLPLGRIIEIIGPNSSGKTTLLLHIAAGVKKMGGINIFLEGEHKFDPDYADKLGAKFDIFSQPDSMEDMLAVIIVSLKDNIAKKNQSRDILAKLEKKKKLKPDDEKIKEICIKNIRTPIVYYIDSLASFPSQMEFEKTKTSGMGEHARIVSQNLRVISKLPARAGAMIVATNQERWDMKGRKITFAGEAMKFYASLRTRMAIVSKIEKAGLAESNIVIAKIIKSNVSKPFRETRLVIDYGNGINRLHM